jgi:hypothetical protein
MDQIDEVYRRADLVLAPFRETSGSGSLTQAFARGAVLGNVGTMIVFRVGAEDASRLAPEFFPAFSAEDLTRLAARQVAIKLCVDGRTSDPFTATTLTSPSLECDYLETIRCISRERYTVSREKAERWVRTQLEENSRTKHSERWN